MPSGNAAFPRSHRLASSPEFARVFAKADRSADRFFTVLAAPNAQNSARLGLTISRRAAKRAVDRNRLKRLARESFRQLDLAPLDFVVMARQGAAEADAKALRQSLDQHFRRLSRRASAGNHG